MKFLRFHERGQIWKSLYRVNDSDSEGQMPHISFMWILASNFYTCVQLWVCKSVSLDNVMKLQRGPERSEKGLRGGEYNMRYENIRGQGGRTTQINCFGNSIIKPI